MSIRVSAPGYMMLLGEHAVLHQQPCLVSALNRRIKVILKKRDDQGIEILSNLGSHKTDLNNLKPVAPFEYVLAAITVLKPRITSGFTLLIQSDFEGAVGLGSSTAVVVATVAAILKLCDEKDPKCIFDCALKAVRSAQERGSGADIAACVYGGVIYYQDQPHHIEKISVVFPVNLIYSGKKMKTRDVIEYVETRFKDKDNEAQQIYQTMGTLVKKAKAALIAQDLNSFYRIVKANQKQMQALGVCDKKLYEIIDYTSALETVHAAKISGSGLGDCAISFGSLDKKHFPYPIIDVDIEPQGLIYS